MKKFFYSVLAASMLFATSCSHEDIVDITKGEGQKVTFKVNLPEQAASRAVADGSKADKLIYAMYESGTTEDATEALICGVVDNRDANGNFTVTVPMAKDIPYDLLFLAYNGEKCAFEIAKEAKNTDLRALQFKSSLQANEDAYDAFVGKLLDNRITDEKEVELTRPFAQVNAATTNADWVIADETLKSAIKYSYLHMSGVPSSYNVFEESASDNTMEVDFKMSESPINETLKDYTDYKYLTFAYVLAGDNTTQSTATAQFEFYREDKKKVSSLVIPNFPLERNHRTNVIGSLLTQYADYKVSIDASIGGDEEIKADENTPSVKDVQTPEQWAEVAALLSKPSNEPISIKLGGNNGRSANDNGIVVDVTANIHKDNTVILDLNGWTLSTSLAEGSQTNHLYAFENHGTLTIIDSSEGKTGKIDARGIFNYGNMTLESGTINAIDGNGGYGVRNYEGATFTMNGGTIATILEDDNKVDKGGYDATTLRVDEGATATINGGVINNICDYTFAIDNAGTITVNGGTFTSIHSTVSSYGTLTINDGSFTCNGIEGITAHCLVTWENSETTINGGTFDGKDNYNGFNVDACAGAIVYIKGGKFLSVHSGSLYGEGTITVCGGTFFDDPSLRLAEGYKAEKDENNFYTVSRPIVATVNGQSYYSFADALNNASDNATIELVEEGEYTLHSNESTKKITITGTSETVIDVTQGAYFENAKVKFEGLTIKVGTGKVNGNGSDYAALYSPNVTYKNCTFIGPMRIGRDGANFVNCTFTELGNDYIWTYGNDCTFEDCTFNTDGKAILIYSDGGNEVSTVFVKNCTFNATQGAKAGAIANQNCAAIEIHNLGNGVNLTTNGNTYDSNFSGEWRIKTYETGKTQVFVNCTEYTTIALDGKTMTIDADRNVTFVGSEKE